MHFSSISCVLPKTLTSVSELNTEDRGISQLFAFWEEVLGMGEGHIRREQTLYNIT